MQILCMVILFFAFLSNPVGRFQEQDLLDLTEPKVRRERKKEGTIRLRTYTMEGHSRNRVAALKVTLLEFDKQSYQYGDEVVFEARLENVLKTPITLPWSSDYDAVKLDDDKFPPGYLTAIIRLTANDEQQGTLLIGGEGIYGSDLAPGSLRQLDPGKAVRIRVRTRLELGNVDAAARLVKRLPLKMQMHARFTYLEGTEPEAYVSENAATIELRKRPD